MVSWVANLKTKLFGTSAASNMPLDILTCYQSVPFDIQKRSKLTTQNTNDTGTREYKNLTHHLTTES